MATLKQLSNPFSLATLKTVLSYDYCLDDKLCAFGAYRVFTMSNTLAVVCDHPDADDDGLVFYVILNGEPITGAPAQCYEEDLERALVSAINAAEDF